jgi:hypothetical protein
VAEHPVGHLAGHLGHALAHGGEEDLGVAGRVRPRVEERRHERVRVEVAAEVELLARVPRRPDRLDRGDELLHPGGRVRPRHGEPLLDVGLDLRAEAEDEAPTGVALEVVTDVGQRHGGAGERHGDAGAELDPLGGPRGEEQREEGVV